MANLDELQLKYELVTSSQWLDMREFMLNRILELVNTEINPLVIQGMLKVISDTDKWKDEFNREKLKFNTQE